MANPATVKDALASLTTDESPATPAYRRPIEEVQAATSDVTAMATFADDDGVVRLRRAIRTATRRGDEEAAAAGREALARIERYRRAAGGGVHFHSARGTVLGRGSQRPDE
ncbi:MAG: hypothetical protein ABEJ78_04980 [Haloferacaceae archaeon]